VTLGSMNAKRMGQPMRAVRYPSQQDRSGPGRGILGPREQCEQGYVWGNLRWSRIGPAEPVSGACCGCVVTLGEGRAEPSRPFAVISLGVGGWDKQILSRRIAGAAGVPILFRISNSISAVMMYNIIFAALEITMQHNFRSRYLFRICAAICSAAFMLEN